MNYSHIFGRARVMIKNTSVIVDPSERVPEKASRLDLVVLELAAAGTVFCRLPWGFGDFRVFIELIVGGEAPRGPHYPPGRAWSFLRALVPSGPHFHLLVASRSFQGLLSPEKNLQKISWHLDFVWY